MKLADRKRRVESIAKSVVATVIDRQEMKEHGLTYFAKNRDLSVDVVTILDYIRTK